jgi:hypothetical protein
VGCTEYFLDKSRTGLFKRTILYKPVFAWLNKIFNVNIRAIQCYPNNIIERDTLLINNSIQKGNGKSALAKLTVGIALDPIFCDDVLG